MANGKGGNLSVGTVTYLQNWYKEQIYERRQEFKSKYCDKGTEVEQLSIDFISDQLGLGMIFKNEQYFENEFITGTPDVVLPVEGIEVKNAWDCFTFPLFDNEPDNKHYIQCQCYMDLTGLQSWRLVHTLMNTPSEIVSREMQFALEEQYDEIMAKHTYDNIPARYRIKTFIIERNQELIDAIHVRVAECREYLKGLDRIFNDGGEAV
jgi:hypothetical protein